MKRFRAPNEHEARDRAWAVVRAAYEGREPVAWPRRHARPLAAGAIAAAALAAVLSPPGRSVIRSLREAVGVEHARPALFSLPTRGQLLVTSRAGAWLVRPDGSKRLLGRYRDAAFSPSARFVVATEANELVALEADGNVRWALARPSPRSPAWAGTRTDTRIAYLTRGSLRVVAGDGTGDHRVGPAAAVPPAWRPGPGFVVAYASGRSVVVYDVLRDSIRLRTPLDEPASKLEWSDDGKLLLVVTRRGLRVIDRRGRIARRQRSASDAAFQPRSHRLAAIRLHGAQSDVLRGQGGRLLFRGTGTFRQLAWSPNGRWLLVTWPTANQWVFVRATPSRRIVGIARISAQFGGVPRVKGWCCAG